MEGNGSAICQADRSTLFALDDSLKTPFPEKGCFTLPGIHKLGDPIEDNFDAWYPPGQAELNLGVGHAKFRLWHREYFDKCQGLVTPTDELTGLPLPILITDPPSPTTDTSFVDYHHLFHPEVRLIHGDDADVAVRRSYGQDLPRWLHEHNHNFFAGPRLPQTRFEKFATVTLACSGIVPRTAIEFTKRGPFVRNTLTDTEYETLTRSVRYEGQGKDGSASYYKSQIGMFFANYAIEQSVEEVISDRVIDEFLHTTDPIARKIRGNAILRECVRMSIDPVIPLHSKAKRLGLIAGRKTDLEHRIHDFFVKSRRSDYYNALFNKWRPGEALPRVA